MVNVFFPGYYPGKKPYKDRRYWNRPRDAARDFFDDIYYQFEEIGNFFIDIPEAVWEEEKKTIINTLTSWSPDKDAYRDARDKYLEKMKDRMKKRAIKRGVAPPEIMDTFYPDLGDDTLAEEIGITYGVEELEDQPGAGEGALKISLKAKDWEEPAKEFRRMLIDRPFSAINDPQDWSGYGKSEAWRRFLVEGERAGLHDLDLRSGIEHESLKVRRDYMQLVRSARGFVQNSTSNVTRNAKLTDFNVQLHVVLGSELEYLVKSEKINNLSPSQRARVLEFKKQIDARNQVMEAIKGKKLQEVKEGEVVNRYDKYSRGKDDIDSKILDPDIGVQSRLKSINDKFDKGFFSARKALRGADSDILVEELNLLRVSVIRARQRISSLSSKDQKLRGTKRLNYYLGKMEKKLADPKFVEIEAGKIIRVKKPDALHKHLKNEFEKMTTKDYLDQGVFTSFTKSMSESLMDDGSLKQLVNIADQSGKKVFTKAYGNTINVGNAMSQMQDWEGIGDFLSDLFQGNVDRIYIYRKLIVPRLGKFAPSYWLKRAKKRFLKGELLPGKTIFGKFINKFGRDVNGVMAKYAASWDVIAVKYLGPIRHMLGNRAEIIKQKISRFIADVATKFIARALDTTTGVLGRALEKVIKVAVRFVTDVVVDKVTKLWEGIKKLDFNILEDALKGIGKFLLLLFSPCLVILALVMLVLIIFMTAFTPYDATRDTKFVDRLVFGGLPKYSGYDSVSCPLEDIDTLSFSTGSLTKYDGTAGNTTVAIEAYNLVSALRRGFWCYWNRHLEYSSPDDTYDLFNEVEFNANPYPAALQNCANCLFWCTWLPYIAYENAGEVFDSGINYLGAQNMYFHFMSSGIYIDASSANAYTQIQPGDIAFFNVSGGSGWHVGMVAYVTNDAVMTIHSNAPWKEFAFTVDTDGSIQNVEEGLTVLGFGRPN